VIPAMRLKNIMVLLVTVLLVSAVTVVIAWPSINNYILTGSFRRVRVIETLRNPVAVTGWTSDSLHLADGRTVRIAGLRSIPSESVALAEATKRGVEVDADGRVWGLVKVHHWCGNDPVGEHIARVDVSDMLLFLRVGEPDAPIPEVGCLVDKPGGTFNKSGWRINEFMYFQIWDKLKNEEAGDGKR
jgi:hypothetical protein